MDILTNEFINELGKKSPKVIFGLLGVCSFKMLMDLLSNLADVPTSSNTEEIIDITTESHN